MAKNRKLKRLAAIKAVKYFSAILDCTLDIEIKCLLSLEMLNVRRIVAMLLMMCV